MNDKKAEQLVKQYHPTLHNQLIDFKIKTGYIGCSWTDYYYIICDMLRVNPKRIVEFGSGCTTLIFNYFCDLTITFEHDPNYYTKLVQNLPVQSKVLPILSEVSFGQYKGIKYNYYKKIDDFRSNNFDYVFVDGPPMEVIDSDNDEERLPNGDLYHVLLYANDPLTMRLDNRKRTLAFYHKILKGKFLTKDGSTLIQNVSKKDLRKT